MENCSCNFHFVGICAFGALTLFIGRQEEHPACNTHTHTHPFNGPLSGTTRVSRYQKGKTNLDCIQPVKELKIEWWGVGVVICLGRGAVVCIMVQHDATAIPNPIISCLVWIQTGFTLLVPAYPGCQGKRLLNGCSSSSWSWKPAVNMQFHQKPAPGTKWM